MGTYYYISHRMQQEIGESMEDSPPVQVIELFYNLLAIKS
jgi:hypothetical protein